MIRISLGGVGSGKTSNEVREMVLSKGRFNIYTNIAVKKSLRFIHRLEPDYIIKKEIAKQTRTKQGELVNSYDYQINLDFWRDKQPLSIVLDEFHNIANARTFMSKKNRVFNTWLTMIRRVLGSTDQRGGELVLISQLSNQVDLIARELCHQIRFHVMWYEKFCRCGFCSQDSSENPEPIFQCPRCNSWLYKRKFRLEIWAFKSMEDFRSWDELGTRSYYKHYYVNDIERYFGYYDTYQWDNLFEDY